LFDDYRRRNGREPGFPQRPRLQEQAALATRPAKRQARSLDELLADWRTRAIAVTSRTVVDNLLADARAAAAQRPAAPGIDINAAGTVVLATVSERRTTFRRRHVLAEAHRYLMRTLAGATAPPGLADEITDAALAHGNCLDITPPEINPSHPELVRADGTSIYRPIGSDTYTTRPLLAAENRLLAGARTPVIPPVGRGTFHRVTALNRSPMDAGQRELARSFALSDKLLLAGLGPAGAGKTTAMRLLARALDATGGRLIALAPSSRAAKVLGEDLNQHAHTLHSWLHHRDRAREGRNVEPHFRLRPGDVVLVDEAGMAGTLLLDRILADATAAGAVVRLLGDPHQLAAVEAGGALRLIARAGSTVELDRLHRFRTPGEADASLLLRDSDDTGNVFDWYLEKGRVMGGSYEAMCDAVFTAWAKDRNRGLNALMTAADNDTVAALNLRAQAWHIAAGHIDTSRSAPLRAGQRAHVGDVIVTRLNRRRMTVRGGRDFVKNGDTWTVQRITSTGDVVVGHTGHRGRIRLPAAYVAAQCELGYASTIYRCQGMTVDTSHALASPRSNREEVYVQLTRGARTNRLYVALDDEADGLERVLASIASRRTAQLSATESIATLHKQATGPGQLAAEFADVAERATSARLTGVLEAAVGRDLAAGFMAADAYPALTRAMSDAERAGFDVPALLQRTLGQRGLRDADDIAAVLTWRLRAHLADAEQALGDDRQRPLAHLSPQQLQALTRLAASHRAAAWEALKAADAAITHLPTPVTTVAGHTHPPWSERPLGPLTRTELSAQLATVRAQLRDAAVPGVSLSAAARATIAALTHETRLRRSLTWRDRGREDFQRERHTAAAPEGENSLADTRHSIARRRAATAQRLRWAHAAVARADAVTAKIAAESRWRQRLPDRPPHRPDFHGIPDWIADRHALTHPDTPDHWRHHLAERHRILTRSLDDRGNALAAAPPAWARPLGPPPPVTTPLRRAAWATTCALVELWRTRNAVIGAPGLGPRPEPPDTAAQWDDLSTRIRALTDHHRPAHQPPPGESSAMVLRAAAAHLDTPPPSSPLPNHPALRHPHVHAVAPLSHAAAARSAAQALTAVLAGQPLPEPWMERITPPGHDDEAEQHVYTHLLAALSDYRSRHHRAGADILGPRPAGAIGEEWDHLTDAIDLYTRARIEHRLEELRARTAARTTDLQPPSPLRRQPPSQAPTHPTRNLPRL
jgi:AAA domain